VNEKMADVSSNTLSVPVAPVAPVANPVIDPSANLQAQSLFVRPSLRVNKYKFSDVRDAVRQSFQDEKHYNSMVADIIAMYLKGQKILYAEAKVYCEQHLNYLMLPAIFITSACTVLTPILQNHPYGNIIVSSLTAFTATLLAIINYIKLDAKAEAHRSAAYKFDKLESNVVFNSGKLLYLTSTTEELKDLILTTEKQVQEIKESNQFILPEQIRMNFPNLYGVNIFSEIKRIMNNEMRLINTLKEHYNELLSLQLKEEGGSVLTLKDKERMASLEEQQRKILDEILDNKQQYSRVDDEFERELDMNRRSISKRCSCCKWLSA
jgi:L-cysteine desulfidase